MKPGGRHGWIPAYGSAIALFLLPGCQGTPTPPQTGGELQDQAATPEPLPRQLALEPSVAALGQQLSARLTGISTTFDLGTTVELGEGVTVSALEPIDAYDLRFRLIVSPEAEPGYRTLTVHSQGDTLELEEALLIQVGSVTLAPALADRGQTIDVDVTVTGITMTPGYTWIDFGEGVHVDTFTPLEDGVHATARVRVSSTATPGLRDVEVQNGATRVRLPDGFTVDRGLIAISFDPTSVSQGETVAYTITGHGTHFSAADTTVDLGVGVLIDTEEDPTAMVVESPTRITGTMKACQSAVIGVHDVTVTTASSDGPPETVQAVAAFTVQEVPITVALARGVFSFYLSRTMRDGGVAESVVASASILANVEYCATSSSSSSTCSVQTVPYDTPSYYPPPGCTQNTGSSSLYPPTPSFDAGDHIYFEVPGGPSITLDKYQDSDGSISYSNTQEIPLDDFWFDTAYDVRADGGTGTASVPAFLAEGVLWTSPSDFTLVEPDLRNEPTLDRYDAFPMTWQDPYGQPGAQTFPVATMYSRLRTVDPSTGDASEIRVLPTDDGSYVFPAEYVSQLYPGAGRFLLQVVRPGTSFIIPGSSYSSNTVSGVIWDGYFELR